MRLNLYITSNIYNIYKNIGKKKIAIYSKGGKTKITFILLTYFLYNSLLLSLYFLIETLGYITIS